MKDVKFRTIFKPVNVPWKRGDKPDEGTDRRHANQTIDDGWQARMEAQPLDAMRKAERVRGYAAAQGISLVECIEILTPKGGTR